MRHYFYCRCCNFHFFNEEVESKCPKCNKIIIAKSCESSKKYNKKKEIVVEIDKLIDVRG